MPRYADHRDHIHTIIRAALDAANPAEAVRRYWPQVDLGRAERVFVVGAGKASAAMAETAEALLGSRFTQGVVAVPASSTSHFTLLTSHFLPPTSHSTFIPAGHPQPDSGSLRAGEAIAELLNEATERDLVLAVISGGASALLELPVPGVTLEELQKLNGSLLRSGAPVGELNCVRKHLSQIKGGGLAQLASPAKVIALILSDVIGDPLDVIGSGPTVPDPTTAADASAILRRRGLARSPLAAMLVETPKRGDPIFDRVTNLLIGSNALACAAAAQAAQSLGFEAHMPSSIVQGEARDYGERLAREVSTQLRSGEERQKAAALIYGGETTVTVRGNGIGGRNQELALAAAVVLDGIAERVVIASFGTDGIDGFSPAAGAFATPETAARARALGLDPIALLDNNDSYSFFNALGGTILTGLTGTNVNDLVIVLAYSD